MLIIELLEEKHGNLANFSRHLGKSIGNTWKHIRMAKKDGTKKRYTKAFNECFGTNYTFNELFNETKGSNT